MKKKILVFLAFVAITLTLTLSGMSIVTPSQANVHPDCLNGCIAGSGGCVCYVWYDYKEGPVEKL
ncbi:MAG: hypothetical protein PF487_02855 [Bacteroidales bacterium]|nr:hypothetical protein [Bacteroidales bacterium]